MRPARLREAMFVFSSVAALLLIAVQPAAAATVLSHSGTTGPYSLTDAVSPPGHQAVVCNYLLATEKLATVTVRHPQVKAVNRTSGRDSQFVGWQFIVQHRTPSGTAWSTIASSSFVKARAYDNLAAAFTDGTWAASATPSGRYRIILVIRWYTPGSTTAMGGQVKLFDVNYESKWNGNMNINPGEADCLQDY